MTKSFLILSMVLLSSNCQIDEIYVGESFSWKVYYDPGKSQPIVEIGGIKYGYLDHLRRENKDLAKSRVGELYTKRGYIYYKNTALKIDVRLKKKNYSSKMDSQRFKIFEINAFNEISNLKDSLKMDSYRFDWQVKEDYIFYRDNDSIPDNYMPDYKKKFYSCNTENTNQIDESFLIGSWAGCSTSGDYFEVHFDGNFYAYQIENEFDIVDYTVGRYRICGGKLLTFIQEKELSCDQEEVNITNISIVSDTEFIGIENADRIFHKRLSNQPLMNYRLGSKKLEESNYLEEFNLRKKSFSCE